MHSLPVQQFQILTPEQNGGGLGSLIRNALNGYYAQQGTQADIDYKQAQTKRESALANLPFGGANVPGVSGQVVGLEMIKNRYGEDSSQYQQAKSAFDLTQQSTMSRDNYQDKLAGSLPIRYTTSDGRSFIEESNVKHGYSPAGTPEGQPVVPGGPAYNAPNGSVDTTNQYEKLRTKKDTPNSVLQKDLYVTNIDKTLNSIDLNALTHYNGPYGQAKLKEQQALDAFGKSDDNYKQYKAQKDKLKFLSSQTRQFYGDSIQPSAMDELVQRFDPTGPFTSAETGKTRFNSNADLLRKEMQTYRDANKSNEVYRGNSSPTGGVAQVNLSGFKNKQEFQSWYAQQIPEVKAAVNAQLKGAG